MADEVLTPDERDLFRRAEAEALAGLSFDLEAGLADVRSRSAVAVPRPRGGAGPGMRARMGVVVGVVMAAFGVTYGFQQATTGAMVFSGPLPTTPGSASSLPFPPASASTSVPPGPGAGPSGSVPSRSQAFGSSGSSGPSSAASVPGRADGSAAGPGAAPPAGGSAASLPAAGHHSTPDAGSTPPPGAGAARPPGAGGARPPGAGGAPSPGAGAAPPPGAGSGPPPGAGSGSSAPPSVAGFRVRYPATVVTVPIGDTGSRSLALDEPKVVDDGPVRITASPGTGDSILNSGAGVLAAMIPAAEVTPGDCAQAVEDAPGAQLLLREDRTYCLMTAGSGPRQTLVRLNVERPQQPGELQLRIKAWVTVG